MADPSLDIVVLEAEVAGFGAAGATRGSHRRASPARPGRTSARGGWDGVQRGERAMIDAIDYVGDVVRQEGIDCGWTKSGALRIATTPAQLDRVRAGVERRRRGGLDESDVRFLSAAELTDRVRIARVVGGTYTPHCARVHPGRLVRGLAAACERRGVRIFERSPVASIEPGTGAVRADGPWCADGRQSTRGRARAGRRAGD